MCLKQVLLEKHKYQNTWVDGSIIDPKVCLHKHDIQSLVPT